MNNCSLLLPLSIRCAQCPAKNSASNIFISIIIIIIICITIIVVTIILITSSTMKGMNNCCLLLPLSIRCAQCPAKNSASNIFISIIIIIIICIIIISIIICRISVYVPISLLYGWIPRIAMNVSRGSDPMLHLIKMLQCYLTSPNKEDCSDVCLALIHVIDPT